MDKRNGNNSSIDTGRVLAMARIRRMSEQDMANKFRELWPFYPSSTVLADDNDKALLAVLCEKLNVEVKFLRIDLNANNPIVYRSHLNEIEKQLKKALSVTLAEMKERDAWSQLSLI